MAAPAGGAADISSDGEVRDTGDVVTDVGAIFDGWGCVHLFGVGVGIGEDSATLTDLDTLVIEEGMDESKAERLGNLSVHELATDPLDPSLAYLLSH